MENRKAYEEVRSLLNFKGGKMEFERKGYQYGVWILTWNGNEHIARSNGSGYPDLDQLYVPKPGDVNLNDYRSYTSTLKPDAWERLRQLFEGK
jgi:hypothetical protein